MQTPFLLILLRWSALTKLYSSILGRSSGVEETSYVSDKHKKSCLYIEIYASICVSFAKLSVGKLLRFQWQREEEFF